LINAKGLFRQTFFYAFERIHPYIYGTIPNSYIYL